MAKKDDNQDTRDNRHEFGGEGPDFDPNDPSQMPDGLSFPCRLAIFYNYLCCFRDWDVLVLRAIRLPQARFLGAPTALILTATGNVLGKDLLYVQSSRCLFHF